MRLPKRPKEESKYWGSNGVKGVKEEKPRETKRIIFLSAIILCTLITSIIGIIITLNGRKGVSRLSSPEISRSKTYNRVEEGEEAVEGTENVKFDAFFLRDLDEDGYAEGIRGTCKEIGKEDTLYMEINVQTAGVLKNAKIKINGQNFYLQTSLPKDEQLKDNYIGNNTKEIEFNDLSNGTQKLITGFVRSGDYTNESTKTAAIGNDTSKYSKENNEIVLTGTYVTDEGEEIEISKTVDFTVDWYGTVTSSITATTQSYQIADAIDEENQTFTANFNVTIQETKQELLLSRLFVEGTIPELNGYAPTEVKLTESTDNFNYDETTRQFTIQREAVVNENGVVTTSIARSNTYKLQVKYSLEAYESMGTEEISIKIPVKGYYEGYNNPNEEFNNPYKSNTASATIVINYRKPAESQTDFSVTVGKYVSNPTGRYMVSKQKPMNMYNGKTDKETNDTYVVTWRAYIGTSASTEGLTMKENVPDSFIKTDSTEDSMENLTTYKGIYFGNITNMLGEDGYIKVYDDETDILLETFNKNNVNKYSSSNPYRYDMPVKRIRIETSTTTNDTSLYVYHVKELDDEALVENYTQEEFENLQYIKSTLDGKVGEALIKKATNQANYEAPISIATVGISKNTLSTQKTEENVKITIQTKCDESSNQVKWLNGAFLVKLPEDILDLEINDVTIDNTNVALTSYELVEQDGSKFIKILTSNTVEAIYNITIDVNITPDPRKASATKNIELYASNENVSDYYYKGEDTYDVNNNLNTTETINKTTTNISLVSPSSLLTNQMASEFDEKGSVVVSPQIAEIKPQVATVDEEVPEKTAKIGIQLKNNYSNTISDVIILGKIPFEGNTYVLTGKELGSEFTTKMTDAGIELPEEVASVAKVYYSENTNPSKDLTDESNAWKTADQVENWNNIKTFIIDLSEYVMPQGQELVFNYTIKIPNGLEYNKVSYSHHGIYFSLDTAEGKYKTQTEPNRIGFKIAEKYNLELVKYQKGKDKLVPGATYKITEEGQTEGKTAITNEEGLLEFKNLYVEKTYLIEEIKVPTDYELNTSVIKFVGHVNGSTLTIEKLEGETREDIIVSKQENVDYKTILKVEDEAKARLKIIKKEQDTENVIRGVKFKITGNGLPETGKILTTNINGEINFKGLTINQQYTLQEVTAKGYYLATAINFRIVNNDGNYELQILSGTVRENSVTEEDGIPIINMTLDNEKIPTYNLEIIKIKKTLDVNVSESEESATSENGTDEGTVEEITYLQGAKFSSYKDGKKIGEYVTGEDGKVTITDLYQYIEGRDEEAIYTLKETLAPDGYVKVQDITFKVQAEDGTLTFINTNGEEEKYTVDGNTVKLTIEDSPSFKLIKKDGETGELLANVKFAIYNVDNGQVPATNSKGEILGTKEVINGKEYYTLTTDQNGEITADLTEGLYKAVEIQAPDKYDIENSTYYFGIGTSVELDKVRITEWAKGIGGSNQDYITSVVETTDGGYIVGGDFESSSIDLGNGVTLINNGSNGTYDGMIIKYSNEGEVEWAKGIGGSRNDGINSVIQTTDGGYIVGGVFTNSSIDLGNGVILSNNKSGYADGMIIKYSEKGEVEWAKGIGGIDSDHINSVVETTDGGCIVVGDFYSSSIDLGNGVTLTNNSSSTQYADGMIIKYSASGEVEWTKGIGGSSSDYINSVAETTDGGYVVGGYFLSSSIVLGNEIILGNNGSDNGMIIKYSSSGEVEWAKGIGGSIYDRIYSVAETSDGGYIVGGYFRSSSIDLGNGVTLTNNNSGYADGMIIKYSEEGEVEWAKGIGGSYKDEIKSVAGTSDGGYIVGGYFSSSNIDLGNGVTLSKSGSDDGMIIKYSEEGEVEWAKGIGGSSADSIKSVAETSDEGYIVGGYFQSSSIDLGNGVTLNNNSSSTSYTDGMIVKISPEIEVANTVISQAKGIGGNSSDYINSVVETSDGGYVVGGYFYSSSIDLGNGVILSNNKSGYADGMIIKYSEEGEVEWAKGIGGSSYDYIESIAVTLDGGYVVGGYFNSSIDLGNGVILSSSGGSDGMIIKYSEEGEVEWAKGIGGSNGDYITSVVETSDGGYIVGGYFYSSIINLGNGVTLSNKSSSTSGLDGMIIKYSCEGEVEWAKGIGGSSYDYIESIAVTLDGGYVVGGYFNSSIDLGNGVILSSSGGSDGMIIKYSEEGEVEWAKGIGGSNGDYITSVVETSDGGYAVGGYFCSSIDLGNGLTLTNNSSSTQYADGMIIKYSEEGEVEWAKGIGGSSDDEIESIAETSDGGYAVGGYFCSSIDLGNGLTLTNNSSSTQYADGMIIKYSCEGEVEWAKGIGGSKNDIIKSVSETTDRVYVVGGYFNSSSIELENGETLISNGDYDGMIIKIVPQMGSPEVQELGVENTRKEYKITTDIQEIDGTKGGSISGEDKNSYETVKYGDSNTKEIIMVPDENYEIISITVNGKEHQFVANEDGTYTMPPLENITEDKHIVVTYALKDNKIIINKIDSETQEPLSGAKFRLEQIVEDDTTPYITEVETDSQGQAITQIPFGKYSITETQAPKGYELNENSIVIEFRADGEHEFTIENKKEARVIVHHYIKDTTTKLVEDEIQVGKEGENYTTAPNLDISGYTLEQDNDGNYIIPENATGTYQSGDQEVIYYYVPQKVKLTVHHYIEGTETPVPLKDGTIAEDVASEGTKGENYITQAINPDELAEGYSLVELPENATGTYQDGEIVVTYYYTQRKGEVIVHHYIKDTTTKLSKDVNKIGAVGSTYETEPATDIPEYYELVAMPENYTGTIGEELTEVIYYYQPKKYEYAVEYYFEGILDETLTENLTAEYGSEISTYPDKVKPKYHFDKSENLPLIITTDPEENIIKIYYRKNSYDITTEVEGEGGSISGEGEQPYESVFAKGDSTKDIIVTPNAGYVIKDIKINGTPTTSYIENEDGTVTLSKFTTMLEDKHVVASFRKLFTIVKQGEEETTLLPGAKFTIKDGDGNEVIDRKGETVGTLETIDGQELYVVTTDEDGRIDLDLKPGKYIITEVQAPENYILPELEADRTYTIEVEAEIKEERELKKSWSNMVSFDTYNFGVFNVEVSQDKGLILSGGIVEETTISAENTVANQDIILTKIGIVDGIMANTDETGKIKSIRQIKSNDENSANLILDAIELSSGEYIAMGAFMGTITIPAEETTTGESMTITSESEMDTYIIKYNSEGKVELLVASEKNMSDGPIVKLKPLQNGELMMRREFTHYEVSGANTVSGEDIILDSTSSGILIVTYSSDGKVKSAKELAINEELLNTIYWTSMTLTSDGGYIISADTNQQITVPAEDTTDGNEIVINQDENKGYQAIAIKCNSDGKVEYIKKIDNEDNQSEFSSLMYINEIDNGYIALEYEGENSEDGSYQERILLLKLNLSLEIEYKLNIEAEDLTSFWSNDAIKIEQTADGSFTMLNNSTGELSNYIEEVVTEAYPADAPTLTVSNELQKYEYKVEYYYDGEIDESLTEILEEKYGKTVESYTDKVKENYVLEKTDNLPLTITNDPEKNVIKIYYATKAEARVQYIDKDTGEIIYEETEDGYVGKEIDTEAKDFENYVLVEEPEEKTVEMQEETIVIKYYYVRVSSGVIEKHIDIMSGEILFNTTYEGLVGDTYSTKPQEFEGYDLVQEKYPENAEGQMEVDVITVTYYYIKKVTITVEYVDIDTNEKIEEEVTINGHEGDEYSTEQKEIEGYEFVEVTEDEKGNMTEDKTITYYYKKIVPIPVEPEEPEQPVTPPESTPGEKGEDPTIADIIIPAAGTTKIAIVLAIIAMIIGVMDVVTYKKYKKLLRNFK